MRVRIRVHGGVDIRCPRAHGNSQSTTARGKWESPKKNASTRSGETEETCLACSTTRSISVLDANFNTTEQEQPFPCELVATGKRKNVVIKAERMKDKSD